MRPGYNEVLDNERRPEQSAPTEPPDPPAPGPAGNPLREVLAPFVDDPLAFLEQVRREHGTVVRLRFFPEMYHLVSDPEDVRRILVTDADRYHAAPADLGRATPSDEAGQRFHELARAAFHGDGGTAAMVPAMVASIAGGLERWARTPGPIDLATATNELALTVMSDVLLGGADLDVTRLAEAFDHAAMAGAVQHNVSVYQRAAGDVIRAAPAFRASADHISAVIDRLIAERRADERRRDDADLLSRVVFDRGTGAAGPLMAEDEVRTSIGVLLVASHSAPASALVWALHLLADHPDVHERLEAEVDHVLGDRPPVPADLARLKFTRLVLLEAMRLYPPVWVLAPRVTRAPDRFGGYAIPAGSKLLISPWLLHRDASVWERPEVFAPDRFTSGEPRSYLPFGAGPWGCVGAQFGLVEARLVLAMVVQRFRWEPVSEAPVVPEPRLALTPRGGLSMRLLPRPEVTRM